MRLRPGYTLDTAERDLASVRVKWQNLYSNQDRLWERYLQTVNDTYVQLSQSLTDPDLGEGLYSKHFWQLANGGTGSTPLLHGTLVREVKEQIAAIEAALVQVAALRMYAERPGTRVVYDTNMLNHWRAPNEVKWDEVLREEGLPSKRVRLVVPLVVIDELDRQKGGGGQLGSRAAKAIRFLESALKGVAPGTPTEIRPNVTLEVRLDPPGHRRGEADVEVLLCAAELDQLGGPAPTRVLTDDFGMHLRAQSMRVAAMRLPDSYRKGD
ncbi:PIN domain-containing protein [Streptomyces sp. NPDC046237]|uniref:PIN domain-containing protein n=1 Tax=Streptomyces sp. NPDC046237 TaxID=3154914 RepID=UPI0033DF5752